MALSFSQKNQKIWPNPRTMTKQAENRNCKTAMRPKITMVIFFSRTEAKCKKTKQYLRRTTRSSSHHVIYVATG